MTMFFNRDKKPSLKRESFLLTESGRSALQLDFSSGSPTSRVLIALETRGTSASLEDISKETRLSPGQVEKILPRLLRSGLVQTSQRGDFGGLDE